LLLLLLFVAGAGTTRAGIRIYTESNPLPLRVLDVRYYLDSGNDRSAGRYFSIRQQLVSATEQAPNLSDQNGMFWIRINIPASETARRFVLLDNAHLNFVNAWVLRHDSILYDYEGTGDHLPFHTRNVYHNNFVFRLPAHVQGAQLLLLVEKRFEPMHLPVHFLSYNSLLDFSFRSNIIIALISGIGIFALLLTVFLYLNMRERLYIYYAFAVVSYLLYLLCDTGYGFMYLFRSYPPLSDVSRPFLAALMPIFYIAFSRRLLNLDRHLPRVYRATVVLLWIYCSWYALSIFLPKEGLVRSFLLGTMGVLIITAFLSVLAYSGIGIVRRIPYARAMFLAALIHVVCTQVYISYLAGRIPPNPFTRNATLVGFGFEVILLTLLISLRFRNYKREAESLLRQINQQQEEIFKNISSYREQQMNHISGILHNSIGAGLSSIKYNLEAVRHSNDRRLMEYAIEELSNLTDEVRQIAHSISPVLLQQKGLLKSLKSLAENYSRSGRIHITLENIGSLEQTTFQNEILIYQILQELMQNAVKHSGASEMLIQLILEPELVSIYAEDNGKGFESSGLKPEGLGFAQIGALIELMKGRLEIESNPGAGTAISIEFYVHHKTTTA